ncbi:hypothetical protein C7458_10475 [Williamsia muralis]|nr:hypothetical protein C7458_10475 [Williamsia marianensis]
MKQLNREHAFTDQACLTSVLSTASSDYGLSEHVIITQCGSSG